jgi:6,7-dimethyl-8-ribityllumazine synthase
MSENNIKTIEGTFSVSKNARFVIVAARFNGFIVEPLIRGASDVLLRHGVDASRITLVRVPGAWELPVVCRRLANGGKNEAVIALGAVIRGATPHFDYVAGEAAKGLAAVALETGVPVAFGVLTTDTIEQAVERAGSKGGNKGADAALVALEMVSLNEALGQAKR